MTSSHGLPTLVDTSPTPEGDAATRFNADEFEPVPLTDSSPDERWLQRLLLQRPQLIPIDATDQLFAPMCPLAREVSTNAGPIDLLCISPHGFLTVVETKLQRNPQARREVLAQVLDYGAHVAQWSYDDLVKAVAGARHRTSDASDPVLDAVLARVPGTINPYQFRASVSECLRHGRFMMAIVSDGYRESTTTLFEYVQKFMHLQFTLRLVELQLFRRRASPASSILVVPRLAARTLEVTRALVRIQPHVDSSSVTIEGVKDQHTSPGVEDFIERLRSTTQVAEEFATLLGELNELGVYADPTTDGVAVRWADPHGSTQQYRIFRATGSGYARFNALGRQLAKRGLPVAPSVSFSRLVASWVPDSIVSETGTIAGNRGEVKDIPLALLARDQRQAFLSAVQQLQTEIRSATPTA